VVDKRFSGGNKAKKPGIFIPGFGVQPLLIMGWINLDYFRTALCVFVPEPMAFGHIGFVPILPMI
jgi:hypothetical protein